MFSDFIVSKSQEILDMAFIKLFNYETGENMFKDFGKNQKNEI
jgi:hypothetical protein